MISANLEDHVGRLFHYGRCLRSLSLPLYGTLYLREIMPHMEYNDQLAYKERKKDILMSFKRPKWPIRPNKKLHLKCCLIFETI